MSRPYHAACPFCGSTQVEILDEPDSYVVECQGCEARGPRGAETESEAWAKWERRGR
jgi:Lar family restriction alleviation protein